tara:strand:- start:519 stop:914 length:396 start_codon:yes stop_codon:yes gene_type:complete
MIVFPISYYSVFLIILLLVNKKYASYFYPFMITSSVVGIICIIIGLTIWPEFDEFQERYFTTLLYDMTYKEKVLSNIVITFFKILIMVYWPINLSLKAFLVSIGWVISYLVMLIINGKYNGKGIGNNSNIQ